MKMAGSWVAGGWAARSNTGRSAELTDTYMAKMISTAGSVHSTSPFLSSSRPSTLMNLARSSVAGGFHHDSADLTPDRLPKYQVLHRRLII